MTDPYGQQPQDPYAPQPPQPPTNPYATPPVSGPPVSPPTPPPVSGGPYGQPQYGQPQQPQYGAPQYGAPQYGQQTPPYGYPATPPQNSMALVSMILSLVGILTAITAPIGAILGHIAMKQIRQTGESGEGMAKTGIIVGWILTGLYALCCGGYIALIIAGVASSSYNY